MIYGININLPTDPAEAVERLVEGMEHILYSRSKTEEQMMHTAITIY